MPLTKTQAAALAGVTGKTKKKPIVEQELEIIGIQTEVIEVRLIGTSPIYFNRLAEKARRELLLPGRGRSTSADRAATLKHDPIAEYRSSVHRNPNGRPTRLCMPASAFKGMMMTAALDLPGTRKAEIGRLLWVEGYTVDIYGIPFLKMDGVRTADINRTPDIRTRAFLPEWACSIRVHYVVPKLQSKGVGNLLVAGGITCGIGDFRQEKGKGSFGQCAPVNKDDAQWKNIVKHQGIKAQDAALLNPEPFDEASGELLQWFQENVGKVT